MRSIQIGQVEIPLDRAMTAMVPYRATAASATSPPPT